MCLPITNLEDNDLLDFVSGMGCFINIVFGERYTFDHKTIQKLSF